MVGGLTPQGEARPHTWRSPQSKLPWTHALPWHYSLLHKRTLTESGSQLKACGEKGGVCSRQSQCQQGGGPSALPLQPTQACPGVLGVDSDGWGVKDSQWVGRHKCHVLRDRKPVTAVAATMSRVYCVDIWRREEPLPHTWGCSLGSSRHLTRTEGCSELTSCEGVAGGKTCLVGHKADGLCDPQLPVRPAPGIACRRARPRDTSGCCCHLHCCP